MKTYLFPAVLAGSLLVAQALSHASNAGDSISLLNIPNSQTDSALVLTPSASLGLEVGGGRAALAAELGFDNRLAVNMSDDVAIALGTSSTAAIDNGLATAGTGVANAGSGFDPARPNTPTSPEPSTLALSALGLAAMTFLARRKHA